jgi:hypothetical protein
MKYKKVPIKFEKGQVITSLYHSPFDLNLFYLICLGKTGLKIRIVLDDIDNLGIDRGDKNATFAFSEKYFLSKTERTNIRPLSLLTPKHLWANLAYPAIKEFDDLVGIRNLKDKLEYQDTVEHWIQDTTQRLGVYSIVGPDKAFAFMSVDNHFSEAVRASKTHINSILSRFKTESDSPIKFVEWLLDENISNNLKISDYYKNILEKIIKHFCLEENVWVEKMSDISIQEKNRIVLEDFKNDTALQNLYSEALSMDGKKDLNDFPFYSVSKRDGQRLLHIKNYIDNPTEYLVAPKVLMLNNFENLVLPYHAISKANVHARELMYSHKKLHCNQVFCDDKWLEWLASFNMEINLDQIESYFYDKEQIDLSSLNNIFRKKELSFDGSLEEGYKNWVRTSTMSAIEQSKYPLIFLALLQDKIFYKEIPTFYKLVIE